MGLVSAKERSDTDDRDAPDGIDLNGPLPHHKIQAIEVSGGFLDGTRLEFVDGLNCIIGGRGTGKTTVLEFIRYVLDLMPDPADSRPRAKIIDGIVRGNLGSGTIALEVETKHGTSYRAERPWGDSVQSSSGSRQYCRTSYNHKGFLARRHRHLVKPDG